MKAPTKNCGRKLGTYVAKSLSREVIGDKVRGIPPPNPRFQENLVTAGGVDEKGTLVPV